MSVRSAQAITIEFITSNPTTQAALNADSTPVGTLVVNGTDNGASVTVTNVDAGRYKAAVTLPTLAIGDIVELSVAATVSAIAGKAIVWRDTKDVLLDGSGDVTFNNTSIGTVTTLTNLPTITTDWLTGTGVAASAVTKIQSGLATPTNITAGTITTTTNLTNLPAAPTDWLAAAAIKADAVTKVQAGLPTAASVATAVWTDTTAGDFTTSTSPGKIIFSQLGGAFTTTSSSVFSTAALANGPTGGSAPTAAAIATAVWQDATAGDFTTASSIGKSLYTLAVSAAGGVTLANSVTHGGNAAVLSLRQMVVNNSVGAAVVIVSSNFASPALFINSTDGEGLTIQTASGSPGMSVTSGAGTGLSISGSTAGMSVGANAGHGVLITGTGGHGIYSSVASGDFDGMRLEGLGAGIGMALVAGTTGHPMTIAAGHGQTDVNVINANGSVNVGNILASALAELFTTDSTKVYADAVTGSPVKEIGSQAGGGGTVDANVVSYATGEDPATLLLASPANKLATDSSGRVTGSATLLDATPVTDPGGVASTFPQMLVQVWRRYFKKAIKETGGHTIKTYADDGTTVRTSQPYTDNGLGDQTQGPAS